MAETPSARQVEIAWPGPGITVTAGLDDRNATPASYGPDRAGRPS